MLIFPLVKEVIKIPAIFLLTFVIVVISFVFFDLLFLMISRYSDFQALKFSFFFLNIPAAITDVLSGALIMSILLMLLRIALKPVPPFLSIIVLYIVACFVYIAALTGFRSIIPAIPAGTEQTPYFQANQINHAGSFFIHPGKIDKNVLQNTVVFDPDAKDTHFSFYKSLENQVNGNTAVLNLGEKRANMEIKNPFTRFLYINDQFSVDILKAFGIFNTEMLYYAKKSASMLYFSTFTLVFFIMACGMFTRITRWPLFNILLFAVMMSLFVILFGFYKTEVYNELAKIMKDKAALDYFPLYIMIGIGILFILIDIIFIPRKIWKEGMQVD